MRATELKMQPRIHLQSKCDMSGFALQVYFYHSRNSLYRLIGQGKTKIETIHNYTMSQVGIMGFITIIIYFISIQRVKTNSQKQLHLNICFCKFLQHFTHKTFL
jgi:hypothetical protein